MPVRFWTKVRRTDGCWTWLGAKNNRGYGVFDKRSRRREPKQMTTAHRIAWELTHGSVPEGLDVCHSCDVRHCVRPDHLWLGTRTDNMQDMVEKGRGRERPANCPKGHPYDVGNTLVVNRPTGTTIVCLACKREAAREYHRKKALTCRPVA